MPETQAQRRANVKYKTEKCDRFTVLTPKGKHELYKAAAEVMGMSLSRLIQVAVEEYMKKHSDEVFATADPFDERLSKAWQLFENFSNLPEDVQIEFLEFINYLTDRSNQKQ